MTFSLHLLPNPLLISSKITAIRPLAAAIPPRDRVIDFGKYKGKMLGTLPSVYLKWVSKNLRARDFEEWAKLADQVLEDPVYKDRIEWEFAQRILNGDVLGSIASSSSSRVGDDAVSDLLEISERFGWDNEDKEGWRRVNFELLGTSKGWRIPRIGEGQKKKKNEGEMKGRVVGRSRERVGEGEMDGVGVRRGERRERMRLKRDGGGIGAGGGRMHLLDEYRLRNEVEEVKEKRNAEREKAQKGGGDENDNDQLLEPEPQDQEVDKHKPFPGREGLLKSVFAAKRAASTKLNKSNRLL